MTPRNNAHDYAKLQDLLPTVAPGTLMQRIAEAFGFTGKTGVKRLINRLRDAGYDMSAYDAAAKARYKVPGMTDAAVKALRQGREKQRTAPAPKAPAPVKAAPVKSANDRRYALMMRAAKEAPIGQLTRVALELFGATSESTIRNTRAKLEALGYDMADWHRAARASIAQGISHKQGRPRVSQPYPKRQELRSSADAPDHVLQRRTQWLTDMRRVAEDPGAIVLLCAHWNCTRDTVYGRIAALRNLGHDLTWWRLSPSRGFGNADAIHARATEVRALPVVEIQARPSRWAAPIPWTVQAVADVAGVTVLKAMWVGRQHGIPFDAVTLDEATAMGLLSALGFSPKVAA
jgi:hypothetical protein